ALGSVEGLFYPVGRCDRAEVNERAGSRRDSDRTDPSAIHCWEIASVMDDHALASLKYAHWHDDLHHVRLETVVAMQCCGGPVRRMAFRSAVEYCCDYLLVPGPIRCGESEHSRRQPVEHPGLNQSSQLPSCQPAPCRVVAGHDSELIRGDGGQSNQRGCVAHVCSSRFSDDRGSTLRSAA